MAASWDWPVGFAMRFDAKTARKFLAVAQAVQVLDREARQSVADVVPGGGQLHEDVSLGRDAGVVVEQAGGDLEVIAGRIGRRHGAAAGRTKDRLVGRAFIQDRGLVHSHQLATAEETVVLLAHPDAGQRSTARDLAAAIAVAQLHGPHRPVDLERDSST